MVHLRPARPQLHVQPVLLINAGRERLVKAAMFGLGFPVRAEIDGLGDSRARERQRGAKSAKKSEKSACGTVHLPVARLSRARECSRALRRRRAALYRQNRRDSL